MPRKYTDEEREAAFQERVDRSGGPDTCWPWTGAMDRRGYGLLWWAGRFELAHRAAWFYATGSWPPPETPFVLHAPVVCHNRACVNVAHLRLGTHADNMQDRILDGVSGNGRRSRTHCLRGHEYTPENTYVTPQGHRKCRECHRVLDIAWREANPERLAVYAARRRTRRAKDA